MHSKFPGLNLESKALLSHIICRCAALGLHCSPVKSQKLLYLCYGRVLAECGLRLTNEQPKIWRSGPAFPKAWQAQREHRLKLDQGAELMAERCPQHILQVIDQTIESFGRYSAETLSVWLRRPGSAWATGSQQGKFLYQDLSDELTAACFKRARLPVFLSPACTERSAQQSCAS
ncbi:MAG: DUF4065 domain-containing protein [Proteobacteria bacterium]|uniref:DUF4065 domain-containing protein n=1 Tax=Candidatus Avisuccinivibrio stercorigallinarum TaxID=2840704 RepID=A0A9D9GSA9_9GAMM|nr:DUF4065 domain-containing protein [Candidatus Avisuccinivibrio stercorigallinarum]